jgi:hypothetical protein
MVSVGAKHLGDFACRVARDMEPLDLSRNVFLSMAADFSFSNSSFMLTSRFLGGFSGLFRAGQNLGRT